MSYTDDFPIVELEHYGVKGMKWGVRKFRQAHEKANATKDVRRGKQNERLKVYKEKEKSLAKSTLQKAGKALGERNARKSKKQDAFHDQKMKSSKVYKAMYEATPKYRSAKGRDRIRQQSAKSQYRALQLNVAAMVVGGTLAAAGSKKGQKAINAVSDFVITGQAQKICKNVLNKVTGNPLRYVNAENMKNIVVDSGSLGGG